MITDAQYEAARAVAQKHFRERKDVRSKTCGEFLEYNKANPEVYETFVRLLRESKQRGYTAWSIQGVIEIARWEVALDVVKTDQFKFPNAYGAYYSRLIMIEERDLYGFMRVSASEADHELGWSRFKIEMDRAEKKSPQGVTDVAPAYPNVAI
jgi:hypothetical protein